MALGIEHPDFLKIDSVQLTEWMAFAEIFPFGEIREDFRAAMTAFRITRALGGSGKFEDFMLPESISNESKNERFLKKMRRLVKSKQ